MTKVSFIYFYLRLLQNLKLHVRLTFVACTIFLLNVTLLPWMDGSSSFGKGHKRLKMLQLSARSLLGPAIPAESKRGLQPPGQGVGSDPGSTSQCKKRHLQPGRLCLQKSLAGPLTTVVLFSPLWLLFLQTCFQTAPSSAQSHPHRLCKVRSKPTPLFNNEDRSLHYLSLNSSWSYFLYQLLEFFLMFQTP